MKPNASASLVARYLDSNPLLLRDLRILRRQGWRTRFFILVIALALTQAFAMFILRLQSQSHKSAGGPLEMDDFSFQVLCGCFFALHGILHGLLGFWSYIRARAARTQLDELLLTPMPHHQIFWWLWLRSLLLGLAIILAIYVPLFMKFDFLYEVNMHGAPTADPATGKPVAHVRIFYLVTTALTDGVFIALLALPWIRWHWLRISVIACAIFLAIWTALSFYPPASLESWMDQFLPLGKSGRDSDFALIGELTPAPTYANWHPLITLSYLVVTSAFYCGLGVSAGLAARDRAPRQIVQILLLGPVCEFMFFHIAAWPKPMEAYNPYVALMLMLTLYSSAAGAIWLGLKWNLLFALSRRPISLE